MVCVYIYITYQIKKCVYNKKACVYVYVGGCFDKYISTALWPPQIKIPDSVPASDAHMLYKPCTRMLVYMIIWSSQYCIRTSNKVICNRIKDLRFELHLYKNQLMFELMINNIHHRIV